MNQACLRMIGHPSTRAWVLWWALLSKFVRSMRLILTRCGTIKTRSGRMVGTRHPPLIIRSVTIR